MAIQCTAPCHCPLSVYAVGLCKGHYARRLRGGDLTTPIRDPEAEPLEVLSLRVPARVRRWAKEQPGEARSALERAAKRTE